MFNDFAVIKMHIKRSPSCSPENCHAPSLWRPRCLERARLHSRREWSMQEAYSLAQPLITSDKLCLLSGHEFLQPFKIRTMGPITLTPP